MHFKSEIGDLNPLQYLITCNPGRLGIEKQIEELESSDFTVGDEEKLASLYELIEVH